MTPIALYVYDKSEIIAYACGTCRIVQKTHEDALACCPLCECGAPREKYYTVCQDCRVRNELAREKAAFDKAVRVPLSDSKFLYCDCCEEYFSDVEEFLSQHWENSREIPTLAWDCDPSELKLDARDIVSCALEDGEFHEAAYESIDQATFEALDVALKAFCASVQERVRSWHGSNRVVLLDAEVAAFLKDEAEEEEEALA